MGKGRKLMKKRLAILTLIIMNITMGILVFLFLKGLFDDKIDVQDFFVFE